MQRHKIVVRIILLILSVINFTLAAPISLGRGIREVRTDVVDVAEDVVTALRKRWFPSDEWSTNAADMANEPPNLASSGSEASSELELDPPLPDLLTTYSSLGSNDFDPLLEPPQPSPGPIDQDNSHPLSVGPPTPAHNKLPLDIDLNVPPHPSQEPINDQPSPAPPSDPGTSKRPYPQLDPGPSKRPYLPSDTGPPTRVYPPSDLGLSTWAHTPSSLAPPTWAHPPSNPGTSTWVYPPSDLGLSAWAHPPSNPGTSTSNRGPSTWAYPPSKPGASTWVYAPSNQGPSTWAHPPPDPSTWVYPASNPRPLTWLYPPSNREPSTWVYPSSTQGLSTWAHPPPDPEPRPEPGPPPDPGPSTPPPPLSPRPQQHGSEIIFSELFKSSRFRRRISCSRSANAETCREPLSP